MSRPKVSIDSLQLRFARQALGTVLSIIDDAHPQNAAGERDSRGKPADTPQETVACLLEVEAELQRAFDGLDVVLGE